MTFFTLWLVRRESLKFIKLRQQFLVSPSHSKLAQARTVLITSVPDELTSDEIALKKWASFVPGGIRRVWIYRDSRVYITLSNDRPLSHYSQNLNKEYDRRIDACQKLEKASSKLLRDATKTWRSRQKAEKKAFKKAQKAARKAHKGQDEAEKQTQVEEYEWQKPQPTSEELLDLVPSEKWPHHRLGAIPFIGKKVNTIEWCKQEIAVLNSDIPGLRHNVSQGKPLGSVFIECNLQIGAHILAQVVSYHEVRPRYYCYCRFTLKSAIAFKND